MTREDLIKEYEHKVEQARAGDPIEVVEVYEKMLEILQSEQSKEDIYSGYRYEWYYHSEYAANLWQSFISNDVLQLEEDEEEE